MNRTLSFTFLPNLSKFSDEPTINYELNLNPRKLGSKNHFLEFQNLIKNIFNRTCETPKGKQTKEDFSLFTEWFNNPGIEVCKEYFGIRNPEQFKNTLLALSIAGINVIECILIMVMESELSRLLHSYSGESGEFFKKYTELIICVVMYACAFAANTYFMYQLKSSVHTMMQTSLFNHITSNYTFNARGMHATVPIFQRLPFIVENTFTLIDGRFKTVTQLLTSLYSLWSLGSYPIQIAGWTFPFPVLAFFSLVYGEVYKLAQSGDALSLRSVNEVINEANSEIVTLISWLINNSQSKALLGDIKDDQEKLEELVNQTLPAFEEKGLIESKAKALQVAHEWFLRFLGLLPALYLGVPKEKFLAINNSIRRVTNGLTWGSANTPNLASLKADVARLEAFKSSIELYEEALQTRNLKITKGNALEFRGSVWHETPTGPHFIVENAHIKLNKGYVYQLTGESGTGKSTLISAFLGLLVNMEGTLTQPEKIVVVPQQPCLPHQKTTLLELILAKPFSQITEKERENVEKYIQDLKINKGKKKLDIVDNWEKALSGGEKAKIALLRQLLKNKDADLIILDEPFASISENDQSNLRSLISRLFPEACILLIDHHVKNLSFITHQIEIKDQKLVVKSLNDHDTMDEYTSSTGSTGSSREPESSSDEEGSSEAYAHTQLS